MKMLHVARFFDNRIGQRRFTTRFGWEKVVYGDYGGYFYCEEQNFVEKISKGVRIEIKKEMGGVEELSRDLLKAFGSRAEEKMQDAREG